MLIPKRKWRYPLAIEHEYAKLLVAYVKREFEIVQTFVPEMADALIRNGIHNDAIGDWIGYLIDKIKRKVSATISAISAVNKIFSKVDKHVQTEQSETFKSVFGAKPKNSTKPRDFETLKTIWVNQNLTLIKSIDSQIMDRIQYSLGQKIIGAVDKEILMRDLMREIQEMSGVSEKRAALIGADQVGKLNGKLVQYRQTIAGIEHYIWRTIGDSRVRPAHKLRDGRVYSWKNGANGEHPGMAIRCRCVAQPLIDEQSFKLAPIKNSYTDKQKRDIIISRIQYVADKELDLTKKNQPPIQSHKAIKLPMFGKFSSRDSTSTSILHTELSVGRANLLIRLMFIAWLLVSVTHLTISRRLFLTAIRGYLPIT